MLVCLPVIEDTPVVKEDKDVQAYLAWRKEQGLDSKEES